MTTFYPFQTQEVRDLAWACFSPPLMHMGQLAGHGSGVTDCAFELTPLRQLWLESLDRDAAPLQAQLAEKSSHRLGIYFEQLWQFFLRQDPEVELVASNLPVQEKGTTLGEFDCIYFCHRRQRHVHLELAVKYFLGTGDSRPGEGDSSCQAWLGPDTRDRLDKKIDHILHRQILLGDQLPAVQSLGQLGIDTPLKEVAVKGQLFQPAGTAMQPPPGYNNEVPFMPWLHFHRLAAHLTATATESARFEILPKMRWLGRAQSTGASGLLSGDELLSTLNQYFRGENYPVLIAALDNTGLESRRFFVTDRDWPYRK